MASHRDGVNPLRPYYIPPTIGEPPPPSSAAGPGASRGPGGFAAHGGAGDRYASKARDILSDIDYKDYIGDQSQGIMQTVKELVDDLLWKYTSVLMAQPFEVAKTVLQVRGAEGEERAKTSLEETDGSRRRGPGYAGTMYDYGDSDSDPDEEAYFTSNVPSTPTPFTRGRQPRRQNSTSSPITSPRLPKTSGTASLLHLTRPDSILDVIGQLWQKEGAFGVWKGANATFLYTVLQALLENWSRSVMSAVFNVPDLGVMDDIDRIADIAAPYPWASLFVAATAAVATGLILAPLDLVRTRLLLTGRTDSPRKTLNLLQSLPSYLCPSALFLPTVLHSLVHPLLSLSTPLILRTRFLIDNQLSPTTFSVAKFCASTAAIFVKLPLETVLRRGQASILARQEASAAPGKNLDTIVPRGHFDGVVGTMYHIVRQEGQRAIPKKSAPAKSGKAKGKAKTPEMVYLKGQGLEGLWRGWKVSWWGLVGLWTSSVISRGGEGEF